MIAVWVVLGIIAIAVIILIHELGHFLAAKAVGIKAEGFSLGFGPEIVGWDRGETHYAVRWFMVGGYVKILGMNPEEEVPEEELPRSYEEAPYWKRAVVVLAGSFAHVLLAMFLFYLVFAVIGRPYLVYTNTVGEVMETVPIEGEEVPGPAYEAGIQEGDRIVSIDGVPVDDWDTLSAELKSRPGETVSLEVERDGVTSWKTVTLLDNEGIGYLGIGSDVEAFTERTDPLTAVWDTIYTTGRGTVEIVKGLASLFSVKTVKMLIGMEPRTEGGPMSIIGAAQVTYQAASYGFAMAVLFVAQIVLFFAIFNLIPLPPFDGGHLLVIIVEKVFNRKIDIRKLIPVAWIVIIVLSVVAIRLMVMDIFEPMRLPW